MSTPVTNDLDHTPAGDARPSEPVRRTISAWIRLPVMLAVLMGLEALTVPLIEAVSGSAIAGLLSGLAGAALVLVAYTRLVRWLEGRSPAEIAVRGARGKVARGFALGLGLFAVTLSVIAAFGGYRILGWGSFGGAVATLGLMCCVACVEELVFRGVVFRILEEKFGSWVAVLVSSLVFGLLHLINPEATLWGAVAISLEAGVLFGAVYLATRSLWLPIGLHLGWNLAESGIFGTAVSGSASAAQSSLVRAVVSGPQALTGGAFGPEASLVAIVVCGVPAVLLLMLAKRRGQIRPARAADNF
jgi:membrane protease YdiL (CAAX protease family)